MQSTLTSTTSRPSPGPPVAPQEWRHRLAEVNQFVGNFGEVADNIQDKIQTPKESKKSKKKRDLKQRLREVGALHGDGSTPKRPKSLKTKTPKGGISISEENEMGQEPRAEMANNSKKPLPAVPKKTTLGTKFSPSVSFEDILNDEAVAA
eukprot:SAG11_NODE_2700_length_3076_cov_20.676520_3_plen_150_part_00